jgi:small subunit ribosomal protein S17
MPSKVSIGLVTSDKMAKTRRVEIPRMVKDTKYGKYLRRRTICYVHDEAGESELGDTVEISECRPLSRLKRWKLVRVVTKAGAVDRAALRDGPQTDEIPS